MYLSDEELIDNINRLKKEKNAIILAHNYQLGEVQDVADFCGDSLELSIKAKNIDENVIVFCGVKFMAETAAILSPEKIVLHPVAESGCPMADMADAETLIKLKAQHPNAVAVCYVNSTADVKTECDIACTSANAKEIIETIPKDKDIIFLPDRNLGMNVEKQTGRKFILWPGHCPTHMRITTKIIQRRQEEFPEAVIMVHPECRPDVVAIADEVLSTGGMIKFVKTTTKKEVIVGTEIGIIHRLQKEAPQIKFIPVSEQAVCMNMKMINLSDVYLALKNMQTIIKIDEKIRKKALLPIAKMIEIKATVNKS